jgi:hypothetical protein
MDRPRWPMIVAACFGAIAIAAAAFMLGRASSSESLATDTRSSGGIRVIDSVPVGVEQSRAGALAAADNYVATSSQTIAQDPDAFTALVRTVWVPSAQGQTLREAERYRRLAPDALENYANGGNGISVIAARKLESYSARSATVLTWGGGFVWGPTKKPAQRWYLVRTKMVWSNDRWRVADLSELRRAAPAPYSVALGGRDANKSATFDSTLRGMSAPIYGVGG